MGDGAPAPGHLRAASAAREPAGSMGGIRPSGNASSSAAKRNALHSMRARSRTEPGCSPPSRPYSVRRRKPPETRGDAESGGRNDCCVSNWPSAWLGWRDRDKGHPPVHQAFLHPDVARIWNEAFRLRLTHRRRTHRSSDNAPSSVLVKSPAISGAFCRGAWGSSLETDRLPPARRP